MVVVVANFCVVATARRYQDSVKCLYFRLLQDVRRDALDRLMVESMLTRYTKLCGLPQQTATLFLLGRALRQRGGLQQQGVNMQQVKLIVDAALGTPLALSAEAAAALAESGSGSVGGGSGADSSSSRIGLSGFHVGLQVRQSGIISDIINVLCDPFERGEKLHNAGNRATLCDLCAVGACLMDETWAERDVTQCHEARRRLAQIAAIVLHTAEFTSVKKTDDHQEHFEALRSCVLGPATATAAAAAKDAAASKAAGGSAGGSAADAPIPPPRTPPVVTTALLTWVRKMWLSEYHLRVNYALFFVHFVELLYDVRRSPSTTRMQLFEVLAIYQNAFELQDRTRASEGQRNTVASRRQALVMEMVDMMRDGLSRPVLLFLRDNVDRLEAPAKLHLLESLCRVTRPPFTDVYVDCFKAILASARSVLQGGPRNSAAATAAPVRERLRKFAAAAPKGQLDFVLEALAATEGGDSSGGAATVGF
jgi:hypothetical protein